MEKTRHFRLTCRPHEAEAAFDLLRAEGFEAAPLAFHPLCFECLREPRPLGESLAHFFGLIYVQDRSSMLAPLLLAPPEGATVADFCAAPGGKASFLAQLAGETGLVAANEPSASRSAVMRAHFSRMCLPQVATCRSPGESLPFAEQSLSHILVDAPCSGWGTLEKNPEAAGRTGRRIAGLPAVQDALLARAAFCLAPGGRLLYSTCTTNEDENEARVEQALETTGLEPVPLAPLPGIATVPARRGLDNVLRLDGASGGQAHFLALLERPGDPIKEAGDKRPAEAIDPQELELPDQTVLDWQKLPPGDVLLRGETPAFLPAPARRLPAKLKLSGFPLGRLRKQSFVPSPRLRTLLPPHAEAGGLDTDDASVLRALVSGASIEADGRGCGLYYKGLPLGLLTRKGRRLLWSETRR